MARAKIARWELTRFKEHPAQQLYIRPLDEEALAALALDMAAKGALDHPVEALPDGTLLDGHQRLVAAKALEWKSLPTLVRHDLAGDPAAAERRLLEVNMLRKQLDPIDRARLAMRIMELDKGEPAGGLPDWRVSELDDHIATSLGVCRRHAKRLRKIVTCASIDVQAAISAGRLPILVAEKLAYLAPEDKARFDAEVAAGGDPAVIAPGYVTEAKRAAPNTSKQVARFMDSLARGLDDFEGREIAVWCGDEECERLLRTVDRLRGFGVKLRAAVKAHRAREKKDAIAFGKALARIAKGGAQGKPTRPVVRRPATPP